MPMVIPFKYALMLFRLHLLNEMLMEGIGVKEAMAELEAAEISPDEITVDRINALIMAGPTGVLQRTPSDNPGKVITLDIEPFDKDNLI